MSIAALPCAVFADETKSPTSWELRPYRIQVFLALDPSTRWPDGFETELMGQVKRQAATHMGGHWQLECATAPIKLRHSMLTDFDAIAVRDLPPGVPTDGTLPLDKIILVSLAPGDPPAPGGYRIAAREFDVATRLWNATVRRTCASFFGLGPNLFAAIQSAFAPLGRMESVVDGQAIVRMRGGAIGGVASRHAQWGAGRALRTVLVEQAGDAPATAKSQVVAWTWLAPQSASGSLVKCRVYSGLSSAVLPDYHPQRMRLALAVTPPQRPTALRVVSADNERRPLAGCDVYAIRDSVKQRLGRTDRQGSLMIGPTNEGLRVLSIQYGEQMIARIPLVPGLENELTLSCSRDERRLAWETSLVELREDLLDFICRREGLLARNRVSLTSNTKLLGQAAVDEFKTSQNPAAWLASLERQREQIAKFAPGQRPGMEKELSDLRLLMAKHLTSGKAAPAASAKPPGEAAGAKASEAAANSAALQTAGDAANPTPALP